MATFYDTFHPFPRLPLELRICIWKMTIAPREVVVKEKPTWVEENGQSIRKTLCLKSPTPVPAVLHANHEARSTLTALYTQAYNSGVQPRYIWVNFNIDIICITADDWKALEYEGHRLRFLTFFCDRSEEDVRIHLWGVKDGSIYLCLEGLLYYHTGEVDTACNSCRYKYNGELDGACDSCRHLASVAPIRYVGSLKELTIILDVWSTGEDVYDWEPAVNDLVGPMERLRKRDPDWLRPKVTIRHHHTGEEFDLWDCPELYRKREEEEWATWELEEERRTGIGHVDVGSH
jgi:hypothetical protein